ncbi:MAG: virulence associated protein [Myxococcales bacterium]|nr:virulence associated protein [Myxococcales bacterium]
MAIVGVAVALAACARGSSGADIDATGGGGTDGAPVDSSCGALPCTGIYVAQTGNDQATGTQAMPLKTIHAAVVKAALSTPPLAVFVQAGTYPEAVAMKAGVSVYGGFDTTWKRDATKVTVIDGPSPAVTFDTIHVATVLDTITVKSADVTTAGASSFAIIATDSTMIELRDVTVQPGAGADGVAGFDGNNGANGNGGAGGGSGQEHSGSFFCSSHTVPAGGAGGTSSCGRNGGAGGNPGVDTSRGSPGNPGAGGTPGGQGGAAGLGTNAPALGMYGSSGANGSPGSNGAAGIIVGTFAGPVYMPANGGDGTAGTPGNGGGGGGGGGGGSTNCVSSGSSGGGGGAGGCSGTGATGGTGGGGSFGVVAINANLVLRASMVTANHGGAGGRGGNGGLGGGAGAGGPGGPYGGSGEQDDGGMGASGANGGVGGRGGHGGGGGGGPSAAVVCVGTATISIPQSTLTGGAGGAGGASLGNPGVDGTSTRAIGCSFF